MGRAFKPDGYQMKKFRVHASWKETITESFTVEAETQSEAEEKVLNSDDVGEDAEIDRVQCLGDVDEVPFDDPNQLKFFGDEVLQGT